MPAYPPLVAPTPAPEFPLDLSEAQRVRACFRVLSSSPCIRDTLQAEALAAWETSRAAAAEEEEALQVCAEYPPS